MRGIGSGCFYHRKRQTMPVTELRVIQAKANILRMQAAKLLQGVEIEHDNRIARLDINDGETAEGIARLVRATWELPLGPIKNLVGAFERAGGIVYRCSFGTKKLDAISQWCRNMPPLIFVNSEVPGDRLRWSMAHELGTCHHASNPFGELRARGRSVCLGVSSSRPRDYCRPQLFQSPASRHIKGLLESLDGRLDYESTQPRKNH